MQNRLETEQLVYDSYTAPYSTFSLRRNIDKSLDMCPMGMIYVIEMAAPTFQ